MAPNENTTSSTKIANSRIAAPRYVKHEVLNSTVKTFLTHYPTTALAGTTIVTPVTQSRYPTVLTANHPTAVSMYTVVYNCRCFLHAMNGHFYPEIYTSRIYIIRVLTLT